jgi:ABC-type microcin C transport system duplicated ATPase subunit YejF
MIFQDALSALNPVFTVGFQMAEVYRKHRGTSRSDARKRAVELLELVKIPAARQTHQRLPAPVLGWHAPARDDRDVVGARPRTADRRRADHRA